MESVNCELDQLDQLDQLSSVFMKIIESRMCRAIAQLLAQVPIPPKVHQPSSPNRSDTFITGLYISFDAAATTYDNTERLRHRFLKLRSGDVDRSSLEAFIRLLQLIP